MIVRLRKLRGDLRQTWGRLATMGLAIAVGVASLAAISTAYVVLDRELNRGYLATQPPSATLEVDRIDAADLAAVRSLPDVAWAEAGGSVWGEVRMGPDRSLPLLLFSVPSFAEQHLNVLRLDAGRWPGPGELVVERLAVPLAQAVPGSALGVILPGAGVHTLTVTGTVYDPSLAPATQQQTVYGYVAPETLRALAPAAGMPLVKIAVTQPEDAVATERTAIAVAALLRDRGHSVGEVRVPPRRHPHWQQMQGVVRLLLAFSMLTLGLSAVLSATLTGSLLASQIREIGVMKAIGASDRQILGMYALLIAGIAAAAVIAGLTVGAVGGRALARVSGSHLNVDLASLATPVWLWTAEAAAGIGLTFVGAWVPLRMAARRSIRECLDHHGVSTGAVRSGAAARWLLRLTSHTPAIPLALRNALRRRTRVWLTLGLMTCAGGMFLTSLNLAADWQRNLTLAMRERSADLELRFARPQSMAAIEAAAKVPGVTWVEPFSVLRAVPARADSVELTHAYSDGEHGSVALHVVPAHGRFLAPTIVRGRWLDESGVPAVVLNEQALTQFVDARVGSSLELILDGRKVALPIAGVIREHMAGATLYMSPSAYARAAGTAAGARGLALGFAPGAGARQLTAAVIRSLDAAGFKVVDWISRDQLARVIGGHLHVLIVTLTTLSLMMAAVAALGIGCALSIGVLERTREFAVLRVIGAGTGAVAATVIGEGLILGLVSVGLSVAASMPVSIAVARVAGIGSDASAGSMLPSVSSVAFWLIIVLGAAALASVHPARTATRANLRLALDYR